MLVIIALAPVAAFLWKSPAEVPMGDAYIHFVYARNLSEHGQLAFNLGMQEGIGTTSILWVLLLAGLNFVGVDPVTAARVLGAGLLMLEGQIVFHLTLRVVAHMPPRARLGIALGAATVAVASGNTVWMALSGMETLLFLTLGLTALLFYERRRFALAGIALGLMALTRTEGLALAAVLGGLELYRRRKFGPWAIKLGLPILVFFVPWLAFLQIRQGSPLPSSFQGKQAAMAAGSATFTDEHPEYTWLVSASPMLHIASWIGYSVVYMTGAAAFPGPAFTFGGPVDPEQFVAPYFGVGLSLALLGGLILVAGRRLWRVRRTLTLQTTSWRLIIAVLLWNLAHNFMYAVLLPIPGAGGRYGPLNQLLIWLAALAGALLLGQLRRVFAVAGLAGLIALSLGYWQTIYADNIDYNQRVRIPAAEYIEQHVPDGAAVGAVDLGPLRYYGNHETVDLFGFINNDIAQYRDDGGQYTDYLIERDLEYLLLFGPGDDGEPSVLNFGRRVGLYDDERFRPTTLEQFSIPTAEWLRGSGPVNNYLPAIEIVHVEFAPAR
ncbi:MAG: hypothetical protein ACE5FI_03800 [Anaerolineales bacterium]